jgi:hypothetical protein
MAVVGSMQSAVAGGRGAGIGSFGVDARVTRRQRNVGTVSAA